jgi:hypothetical protein
MYYLLVDAKGIYHMQCISDDFSSGISGRLRVPRNVDWKCAVLVWFFCHQFTMVIRFFVFLIFYWLSYIIKKNILRFTFYNNWTVQNKILSIIKIFTILKLYKSPFKKLWFNFIKMPIKYNPKFINCSLSLIVTFYII